MGFLQGTEAEKNEPIMEEESISTDNHDNSSTSPSGTGGDGGASSTGFGLDHSKGQGSNMVYFVLGVAAVVFATATYLLLNASSEREFESEFQSFARETADIAENNAKRIFGQLRSLATAVTSIAIDEENIIEFPNVTVPHFDLRTQEISDITGAEMILYIPLVSQVDRLSWEAYAREQQDWIVEDYEYRDWDPSTVAPISDTIYDCTLSTCGNQAESKRFENVNGFYRDLFYDKGLDPNNVAAPVAQFGPAPVNSSLAMLNLFSHPIFRKEMVTALEYDLQVVSEPMDLSFLLDHVYENLNYSAKSLRSFTLDAVKEDFGKETKTIGFVISVVPWEAIFLQLLPENVNGIYVVVESDCGAVFTYTANGGKASTSQVGDRHEAKKQYEDMAVRYPFGDPNHEHGRSEHCHFELVIYPSDEFRKSYESMDAALYAGLVGLVFVFTAVLFVLYDKYIQKKQEKVIMQAKRAEAIVTSVFPKEVGLRLIEQAEKDEADRVSSKKMLNNFLADSKRAYDSAGGRKPIADLFPETTVMFADIVGFTAWSSMREPTQVFMLLESIYRDFDAIANRRRVFKVETVGDCYVAVCGLPDPRKDHAVVMCRFAADCLLKMAVQVQALEVELGPDTADLGIRIGLNSGPVTAGVLRGDRARFQLFGDTVNTCARIESTGMKNKIHLSKETADRLISAGKGDWIAPRGDKVSAKGKGELETYWLKNIKGGAELGVTSESNDATSDSDTGRPNSQLAKSFDGEGRAVSRYTMEANLAAKMQNALDKKLDRLVNWNVDVLFTMLTQIARERHKAGIRPDPIEKMRKLEESIAESVIISGRTALDEVVEIIELPRFDARASTNMALVELGKEVRKQLHDYVRTIATMHNNNPFHNFEHASHVTMSVRKLLGRIVAPDIDDDDARNLHDHTYGITSDPLTQFAVVLSALLHDVDHSGVPNAQLIKEGVEIAALYRRKSVAEQNSIDLAWSLLMLDRFKLLRQAIYTTKGELHRFRQLVVNTILATDIMDKELQTIRKVRWDKAFSDASNYRNDALMDTINRKATIVIEHLIQASDVAHTMQHWQVYRKWNGRLFLEMYKAYKEGRSEKDPSESWYQGEIGFFDFYVIPLAKKLEDCGVFGVSSHEYLNYAEQNRKEWAAKGQSVVAELVREAESQKYTDRRQSNVSTNDSTDTLGTRSA